MAQHSTAGRPTRDLLRASVSRVIGVHGLSGGKKVHPDGVEFLQDLPLCTAPSEAAAKDRFPEFAKQLGERYPAIVHLREGP